MKIHNSETIYSYFIRVAQIKEQLEVVEENEEEGDILMTSLNGLPISLDSFIQGICARRNLISFNKTMGRLHTKGRLTHNMRGEYGRK